MSDGSGGGHPPPDRSLEHPSPARKRRQACVPSQSTDDLGDELRRLKSYHEGGLIDGDEYKAGRQRALLTYGMLGAAAPPSAPVAVAAMVEEEVTIFLKILHGLRTISPLTQRSTLPSNSWNEVLQSVLPSDYSDLLSLPVGIALCSAPTLPLLGRIQASLADTVGGAVSSGCVFVLATYAPLTAAPQRQPVQTLTSALMTGRRGLPEKYPDREEGRRGLEFNLCLFNTLIESYTNAGLHVGMFDIAALKDVTLAVRDAVQYLWQRRRVPQLPKRFRCDSVKARFHTAPTEALRRERMRCLAAKLAIVRSQSFLHTSRWKGYLEDFDELYSILSKLHQDMLKAGERTSTSILRRAPIAFEDRLASSVTVEGTANMRSRYVRLLKQLQQEGDYNLVLLSQTGIDKDCPPTMICESDGAERKRRQRYREELQLTRAHTRTIIKGLGGHGDLLLVWLVPDDPTKRDETAHARVLTQMRVLVPEYHSRAMRRSFQEKYSGITGTQPMLLQAMYADLTLDGSAPQDAAAREREQQVLEFIMDNGEDPELLCDFRKANGNDGKTYNIFFTYLQNHVDTFSGAADNRHGEVRYAGAEQTEISIPALMRSTVALMQANEDAEVRGAPVPSPKLVEYALQPPNPAYAVARRYSGKCCCRLFV